MRLRQFLAFNPSRHKLEQFLQRAAASTQPTDRVLDAGAGDSPYRRLFSHTNYEATDLGVAYGTSTALAYVCDLTHLPTQAAVYDKIICTQVLEHVPEPARMLAEFYRLLKPGGQLWLSAPLFYPEHQVPYDYYRYTRYGLRHLIESVGFRIEQLEPLEGYFATLAFQCQKAARALSLNPKTYSRSIDGYALILLMVAIRIGAAALSVLFAQLDVLYESDTIGHSKNYTVTATKPLLDMT